MTSYWKQEYGREGRLVSDAEGGERISGHDGQRRGEYDLPKRSGHFCFMVERQLICSCNSLRVPTGPRVGCLAAETISEPENVPTYRHRY